MPLPTRVSEHLHGPIIAGEADMFKHLFLGDLYTLEMDCTTMIQRSSGIVYGYVMQHIGEIILNDTRELYVRRSMIGSYF